MTYQVLARKWRPQDFASLVGQEHVVTALGNALSESRIAQAYLFSGIRGVGKTTAARVLAKALNCERGPAADPCNECTSCVEITSGHSLDVIEVDAATYSKVEQVRELTETLRYGPARGRYKVVVLDEVHRLSRQAFDALLKIVEEPPEHLVFIFATTEIDAVPATILSRCQEFQFRRVTQPVLAAHLRTISEAETINVSDAALRMIARAGEGSVRDSVALLDQMATFGSGSISDEDAQRILGGLDAAIFQKLLAALLGGDRQDIVTIVREIEANGWDPHNVYAQFLVFLRDALHLTLSREGEGKSDLPAEEAALVRQTVEGYGYESILQILQVLISSEPTVRRSEFSLLALEIAWLRAAELPKVTRLQDILSGIDPNSEAGGDAGGGSSSRSSGSGPSGSGSIARSASAAPKTLGKPTRADRSIEAPFVSGPPLAEEPPTLANRFEEPGSTASTNRVSHAPDGPEPDRSEPRRPEPRRSEPESLAPESSIGHSASDSPTAQSQVEKPEENCDPTRIPDFLELLANRRQSLAAHFEHATLRFERRKLLITPPAGDFLLAKALEREPNQKTLEEGLLMIWGEGVSWKALPAAKGPPVAASPPPQQRQRPEGRPSSGFASNPAPHGYDSKSPEPFVPASQEPDWTNSGWQPARANSNGSRVSAEEAAALSELPVVRYILSTFGGKIQSVESVSEDESR